MALAFLSSIFLNNFRAIILSILISISLQPHNMLGQIYCSNRLSLVNLGRSLPYQYNTIYVSGPCPLPRSFMRVCMSRIPLLILYTIRKLKQVVKWSVLWHLLDKICTYYIMVYIPAWVLTFWGYGQVSIHTCLSFYISICRALTQFNFRKFPS